MFMFRGMIAYALIQAVALPCPGLAQALSSLKASLCHLVDDLLDPAADARDDVYVELVEKAHGFSSHAAGNNTADASLVKKLRQIPGMMPRILENLSVHYLLTIYLYYCKRRTASEVGRNMLPVCGYGYLQFCLLCKK